jgi:hypothetical protein
MKKMNYKLQLLATKIMLKNEAIKNFTKQTKSLYQEL